MITGFESHLSAITTLYLDSALNIHVVIASKCGSHQMELLHAQWFSPSNLHQQVLLTETHAGSNACLSCPSHVARSTSVRLHLHTSGSVCCSSARRRRLSLGFPSFFVRFAPYCYMPTGKTFGHSQRKSKVANNGLFDPLPAPILLLHQYCTGVLCPGNHVRSFALFVYTITGGHRGNVWPQLEIMDSR